MPEFDALITRFARYGNHIEETLRTAPRFEAVAEDASAVQVERALVFPLALTGRRDDGADRGGADTTETELAALVDRLVESSSSAQLEHLAVVDRHGHHRPVYRPLLVYAWLQAFRLTYESLPRPLFGRWEEGLRPWCDLLESQLGQIDWPSDPVSPTREASVAEAAWIALALHVAGTVYVRDAWTDLASDTFGRLVRSQASSGAMLGGDASAHPETHWYHELVVLHAAASYAVQAEDRTVADAVERATEFHQAETQPDHATIQPWAFFAFLWNDRTSLLADQVLHASSVQQASGAPDAVSMVLLADALYCLRLFK